MRNIAAVIVGIVIGSIVNGGLVAVSPSIFPLPEGAEPAENTCLLYTSDAADE